MADQQIVKGAAAVAISLTSGTPTGVTAPPAGSFALWSGSTQIVPNTVFGNASGTSAGGTALTVNANGNNGTPSLASVLVNIARDSSLANAAGLDLVVNSGNGFVTYGVVDIAAPSQQVPRGTNTNVTLAAGALQSGQVMPASGDVSLWNGSTRLTPDVTCGSPVTVNGVTFTANGSGPNGFAAVYVSVDPSSSVPNGTGYSVLTMLNFQQNQQLTTALIDITASTAPANPQLVAGGPAVTIPLSAGVPSGTATPPSSSAFALWEGSTRVTPYISVSSLPVTVSGITCTAALVNNSTGGLVSVTLQAAAGSSVPNFAGAYVVAEGPAAGCSGLVDISGNSLPPPAPARRRSVNFF